ncbi:hypothetical protein [uncultured Rhodospira sp.]|uniref:hypothetical protein n=1 Tax=uncultured Rhodospira sp. TaxID=1936189 RepID=UPI002638BC07|nr:hypothetical protein [uncultured Rhodospira sp.]
MITASVRAACLGLVLLLGPLVGPAAAHNMKVFATVEAGEVSGYGFFVGGGRARNAAVTATTGDGRVVFEGTADAEGRFSFTPEGPAPQGVTITLKVGDGHMASITLDGDRFGGAAPPSSPSPTAAVTTPAPQDQPDPTDERLAALIEARVEAAVARQIRPLLEAQAEAEARIRVKDIAGGLGMILGLVGIALWALSRRRDRT